MISRGDARSRLGIAAGATTVVCVSRLGHEKGIDVLLDAFAQLGDAGAHLYVVGDGAERAALERRARELDCAALVTFAGTRPHDEIQWWLAAAGAVVLASRAEGMPNAVIEALASGRPVVATTVGGIPELVTDPALGRLVPPEDPTALAAALRDALSAPWHAPAVAASVASRTWDEVARRKAMALALASRGGLNGPEASRGPRTSGS